ncbi:MAG: hypothetical protein B7Z73_19275, partial [Planctomycetia bacterium 21-64-5]
EALSIRRRETATVKRVARLSDLVPGQPKSFPVVGSRRDAWTLYPDEVIGRVWLLCEKAPSDGRQPDVKAFTAVCPHLGCAIQHDAGKQRFLCPCHRATFDLAGQPLPEPSGKKSHAPRGMDGLECRLVRDQDESEWWVEVRYERFEQGLTVKVPKV